MGKMIICSKYKMVIYSKYINPREIRLHKRFNICLISYITTILFSLVLIIPLYCPYYLVPTLPLKKPVVLN
jgi:hypothetical protein